MMKKIYISPEVEVMKIQSQGQMLTGSLTGIGGDSGMGYGGGSDSEIARSRDFEDFDERYARGNCRRKFFCVRLYIYCY